ncbi:GTP pyrophosphokinase [Mycobacteroides abscessus]|uniref:GTP pyrophosphokinase n=1 Tax=Mycobacteroides abscessus TaxID=36809 RepID=UPI0009A81408|nr:RelA/SpoT domain-containing protein [Mycobacteroides abscessus]
MDEQELATRYTARQPMLVQLAATLEAQVVEILDGVPHIDRIVFRVKMPSSFVVKATKKDPDTGKDKYSHPFSELEDQVAGRVLTFFRSDIDVVRARLVGSLGPVEYEPKEPKDADEFGYESDHFVFVIPEHHKPEGWHDFADMPTTFELQLRTLFMHAWAEPQHDIGYKSRGGENDRQTKRELAWVAASAWGADRILNEVAARLTTPN